MKRGGWGGLVVAGVLIFAGVLAAQADVFDTLQELCDIPAAHDYCKEQGGCHLVGAQAMQGMMMERQQILMQAYQAGIEEGKRQAEEAAKSKK